MMYMSSWWSIFSSVAVDADVDVVVIAPLHFLVMMLYNPRVGAMMLCHRGDVYSLLR